MPRKAKRSGTTQTGAPAAAPTALRGQPYGEGERALESQRRTPVPSGPPPAPGMTAPSGAPGGQAGGSGSSTGGPDPRLLQQMRMQAAMQAAGRMKPPTSLYAETQRPSEPITAGMALGPGAGPEVVRTGDRVARTFRMIADVTGDPRFQELADLAARRGR
jgi:hypothetical protein